jgi:hypothetical protein
MKKYVLPVAIALSLFASFSFRNGDILCNAKALNEKANFLLDPFKYDNSEVSRIIYTEKESVKEIEVPLFIGEKYRFVFEMEALPKPVEVRVYNKNKDNKNRKLLFTSKDMGDKREFIFETPSLLRTAYVEYVIPPADAGSQTGCALFMLGYKIR